MASSTISSNLCLLIALTLRLAIVLHGIGPVVATAYFKRGVISANQGRAASGYGVARASPADVDLEAGKLAILRSLQRRPDRGPVFVPKTGKSRRRMLASGSSQPSRLTELHLDPHTESGGDTLERSKGRLAPAGFQTCNDGLGRSEALSQLVLTQSLGLAELPHLATNLVREASVFIRGASGGAPQALIADLSPTLMLAHLNRLCASPPCNASAPVLPCRFLLSPAASPFGRR